MWYLNHHLHDGVLPNSNFMALFVIPAMTRIWIPCRWGRVKFRSYATKVGGNTQFIPTASHPNNNRYSQALSEIISSSKVWQVTSILNISISFWNNLPILCKAAFGFLATKFTAVRSLTNPLLLLPVNSLLSLVVIVVLHRSSAFKILLIRLRSIIEDSPVLTCTFNGFVLLPPVSGRPLDWLNDIYFRSPIPLASYYASASINLLFMFYVLFILFTCQFSFWRSQPQPCVDIKLDKSTFRRHYYNLLTSPLWYHWYVHCKQK